MVRSPLCVLRNYILSTTAGNVVRQADQMQVPVPTVRLVYHTLLEMNRQIQELKQPLEIVKDRFPQSEAGLLQAMAA